MTKLINYFKLGLQPILFAIILVASFFSPILLIALLVQLYNYIGIWGTIGLSCIFFVIFVTLIGKSMSND